MPLTVIVRDERYQLRARLNEATVHAYANVLKSGRRMPPIKLARVDGALVLVDGWHRVAALERNGARTVEAEITATTATEARWLAARANLEHGLPLKRSELRAVFRCYVSTRQHLDGRRWKSYRDIARELGGRNAFTTIRNWMIADFPKVAKKMGGMDDPGAGSGGLIDASGAPSMLDAALSALRNVEAAARGVSDAAERTILARAAQETFRRITQAEPWRSPLDEFEAIPESADLEGSTWDF